MATEHEFKYMIDLDIVKEYPEDQLKAMCDGHKKIKQGYLAFSKGMTARVRCATENHKSTWFLTMKQKVKNRVIEIETKIDDRDGHDLWEICVGKIKKDRYVFDVDSLKWELDLFKKGNALYFVLAEVELSEGSPRPKSIPDFLAKHLAFEVPLGDDRFSNKRLGCAEYASTLYDLCATLA